MSKILTDAEYIAAMQDGYGVSQFMGGISGERDDATIFLHSGVIELVQANETERISEIRKVHELETRQFLGGLYLEVSNE